MNNGETQVSLEPIAIIGMTGRFPGARNLDQFWRNLADGVESVILHLKNWRPRAWIGPC